MKKRIWILPVIIIPAFLFTGCGGSIRQTISPSPTPNVQFMPAANSVKIAGVRRVCVFPFADYSQQQSFLGTEEWGGNIKIVEEITDQLVSHGLSVAVQEDVNSILADCEVIRPLKKKMLLYGTTGEVRDESDQPGSIEYEMKHVSHDTDIRDEMKQLMKILSMS